MHILTREVRLLATMLAVVGLGALVTACSDSTKVEPVVDSVVVTPNVVSLETGDTTRLSVKVRDAKGNTLARTVTLVSSDPAIVTVDASGLVTAVAPGTATISATCEDKSVTITATVNVPVKAVAVSASGAELEVGDVETLHVTITDENGATVSRPVAWASSNAGIATVDESGKVTAVAIGTVTITATSHGKQGSVTLTIAPTAAKVEISGTREEPLHVDSTMQLTAVVKNDAGAVIQRSVRWSSSDTTIATVDNTGLVKGKGSGTQGPAEARITATAGKVSDSVTVRVVGGSEGGEGGNNLSYPVVFAEGYGLTGLALTTGAAGDPGTGLRPLSTEGITVDKLPFWYDRNTPDYDGYFMQQGSNTWQAEWVDGRGAAPVHAQAAFGDNVLGHTFDTHGTIHVEVALYDESGRTLMGYNMHSLYSSQSTEMQGADGTTALFTPTIFTVTPRLLVSKLDTAGGKVLYTQVEQPLLAPPEGDKAKFAAEVTVSGKLVYGYNLRISDLAPPMPRYGWWRIAIRLDDAVTVDGVSVPRNVVLVAVAAGGETETPLYTPQVDPATNTVWVDICVLSPKEEYACPGGSSGGSGGGGSGGDGHGEP